MKNNTIPPVTLVFLLVCFFLISSCSPPKYQEGLYAEIITDKGQIVLELAFEETPMTVANFVGLAEGKIENAALPLGTPYFDGTTFHRVVANHVIQAGIPKDGRKREPGYTFPNEIHSDLRHSGAGMLGMANSGPHTNSSQFYITLSDRSYLDDNYTVFGHTVEGLDVVHSIVQGDVINSITIVRIGKKARKFKPDTASFQRMVMDANEKVRKDEEVKAEKEANIFQTNWPDAISTESGLKYVILQEGRGQKPGAGMTIKAVYSGRTIDGDLPFTSGENGYPTPLPDATPFDFKLDDSRAIAGVREALLDMKKGEKRILILSPDLAFRTSGFYANEIPGQKRFVIPPNTTLVFELEVMDIFQQ